MGYFVVHPASVQRAVTEDASQFFTRFGNRVLANADARCNVDTGLLRSSLYTELIDGGRGCRVGATAPYALYVHQGTTPHVIRPGSSRRFLRFTDGGRNVFVREVHHPGYAGRAFIADAMYEEAARV